MATSQGSYELSLRSRRIEVFTLTIFPQVVPAGTINFRLSDGADTINFEGKCYCSIVSS